MIEDRSVSPLRDGDLFNLNPGPNPLYAEYLHTAMESQVRLGWRLTNKYGAGLLLERDAMQRLHTLLGETLGIPSHDLAEVPKINGDQSDSNPATLRGQSDPEGSGPGEADQLRDPAA